MPRNTRLNANCLTIRTSFRSSSEPSIAVAIKREAAPLAFMAFFFTGRRLIADNVMFLGLLVLRGATRSFTVPTQISSSSDLILLLALTCAGVFPANV